MALSFTPQTVSSGHQSTDTIEENNTNIQTALTDGLSRSGTSPNAMKSDLDMDSNDLLNVKAINTQTLSLNGTQVSATSLPATEIPDQSGNADKFLQTNGTATSWAVPDSGDITYDHGGTGSSSYSLKSKLNQHVSVVDFGATGDGTTDDTTAIQAAIDYCETLVEAITVNYDIITAALYFPAGRYVHTGLTISAARDGLKVFGEGIGQSVLTYTGTGVGITCGTEVSSPNFSHVQFHDLTVRGNESSIQTGSIGIQFNRCNRASGVYNCQILGFDYNIDLNDCWTFKLIDNHNHDAGTNLVRWENCNGGEIRGGRYDDAGQDLIVLDGSGSSNQSRAMLISGASFQEASRSAIRCVDMTSLEFNSAYFENNNQDDGNYSDIRWTQGASTRNQGTLTLINTYHTPGAASWTGTEYAVDSVGLRYLHVINCSTGSSSYNAFANVDSNCRRVVIDGCLFVNMSANSAVSAASTDTEIIEYWTELDGSDNVTKEVRRDGGLYANVVTTGSNVDSSANTTTYNLTGNSQTLTLRSEEEITNKTVIVRKHTSTGQLIIDPEGATQVNLAGSTNNTLTLSGAVGTVQLTYSGSSWIAVPYDGTWVLAA